MSAALGLLAPLAVLVVAGGTSAVTILVHARWSRWRGRRRVRAAVEQVTARHVVRLVPPQRVPTDPQSWWDLVLEQDGDER